MEKKDEAWMRMKKKPIQRTNKSVCRWCEITKEDKKPQGLWRAAE